MGLQSSGPTGYLARLTGARGSARRVVSRSPARGLLTNARRKEGSFMSRRTRPVLGALAAASLLAAGCGSSGHDASSKAPAPAKPAAAPAAKPAAPSGKLKKAEYVRQADNICREAQTISKNANVAVTKAFNSGKASDAAAAIDQFTPAFTDKMKELHALQPPSTKNVALVNLLQVMDAQLEALSVESAALRQGDQKTLKHLAQTQQKATIAAEQLGKRYGFKVCGRTS
jgi:hypothetical protein